MLGAQVPAGLVFVQITGLPGDLVAAGGQILQRIVEQIVIVGFKPDFAPILQIGAVAQQLAAMGEAVLFLAAVFPKPSLMLLYLLLKTIFVADNIGFSFLF